MEKDHENEEQQDATRLPYEAPQVEESARFETLALQCSFQEGFFCEIGAGGIGSS